MACVDFAWYVIWTNKAALGKNHNTTWHAWGGVFVLFLTNAQCILSSFSMWPGKSIIERAKDRDLHILGGKVTFFSALITTSVGYYKLRSYSMIQLAWFNVGLAIIAIVTLTRMMNIRSITKFNKIL